MSQTKKELMLSSVASILKIDVQTMIADPLVVTRSFDLSLLPKPETVAKHWNICTLFCKLFVAASTKANKKEVKYSYATAQQYFDYV